VLTSIFSFQEVATPYTDYDFVLSFFRELIMLHSSLVTSKRNCGSVIWNSFTSTDCTKLEATEKMRQWTVHSVKISELEK
jgi:hypothetical protein